MIPVGIWLAMSLTVPGAPSTPTLLGELERLDKALAAAETRMSELAAERNSVEKEIARLDAELASTRVRRQESMVRYKRRLQALARMPTGARLVVLGGTRSLTDYLETTRILRWITAHDHRLHQQLVEETDRLSRIEGALVERRSQIAQLEATEREERDDLAARRGARMELIRSVVKKPELTRRLSGEQKAAGRALARMVQRLTPRGQTSASFVRNRGRLPWPAVGAVDVRFGQRVEGTSGTSTVHNGLDIRAAAGAKVQAVAAGRVAFADWLRGYGRVVIVDHGGQYHSLCAHLGSLTVQAGAEVEQGQTVGTVGDSGSLRGTVLYFEVRQRGRPTNPAVWLRK